jgi:D-sedoheptulose 7-phosphate isomerase
VNGHRMRLPLLRGRAHVAAIAGALQALDAEVERLEGWGAWLGGVLRGGGRLLAAGNGGSASQAQHLTGELVGRYHGDRPPFAAIALHAETSSLTAIGNDYGLEEAFARQVRAHGRPGDVLVALSTSGRSANVLAAARAAIGAGLTTWALTGPRPNPLAELCDDAVTVDAPSTATIQEVHLVAVHLLCAAVEMHVASDGERPTDVAPVGGSRE